jgi:hypothetical protein
MKEKPILRGSFSMLLKQRSSKLISILCLIIGLLYLSFHLNASSNKPSVDIASPILPIVNESHRHVFEPGKTLDGLLSM